MVGVRIVNDVCSGFLDATLLCEVRQPVATIQFKHMLERVKSTCASARQYRRYLVLCIAEQAQGLLDQTQISEFNSIGICICACCGCVSRCSMWFLDGLQVCASSCAGFLSRTCHSEIRQCDKSTSPAHPSRACPFAVWGSDDPESVVPRKRNVISQLVTDNTDNKEQHSTWFKDALVRLKDKLMNEVLEIWKMLVSRKPHEPSSAIDR